MYVQSNDKQAAYAILSLQAILVLHILMAFSDYRLIGLLSRALAGDIQVAGSIRTMGYLMIISGILLFILFVICAITFIKWFQRAYKNLGTQVPLDHTAGWAVGAWFVPILSLFRPCEMMVELYNKTTQLFTEKIPCYQPSSKSFNIGIWWTFWVINSIIGFISLQLSKNADSLGAMKTSMTVSLVNSVVAVIAAYFAIRVIRNYSEEEHLFFNLEEIATQPPPIPGEELELNVSV